MSERDHIELAIKSISDLVQVMPENIASTFRLLKDFLQEITNLKGVEVQIKSFRLLDIKFHIVKEADVLINKELGGIGKLEALRLSQLVHFQAEICQGANDLELHAIEGISLVASLPLLDSKQVIPLKGSSKISRDQSGQIVIMATTYLPGINMPVTVSVPLKKIVDEISKQVF